MYVRSFKELLVWQKSMDLVSAVYSLTRDLPKCEQYGLTSQMRRCAVSIPSNIAEGKKRTTRKDFVHFLCIADSSAAELETQLLIAKREFVTINSTNAESLLEEVQKMLSKMIQHLKTSNS